MAHHDHWQNYWNGSVTGSFGSDEPAWYRLHILPRWQTLFESLPDGSRILDIATGNGAVTRVALKVASSAGKQFEIEAVDRVSTRIIDGVTLLPPSSLEQFQPQAERYQLISSQFGLEYARPEPVIPRLATALKPEGRIAVIAHHVDSLISHNSREELAQYRSLLQDFPVFERMEKLILVMGEIRSTGDRKRLQHNPRAQQARLALNRCIARLTGRHPQGIVVAEVLKQAQYLFQQGISLSVRERTGHLKRLRQHTQQARQRITDQLNAALDGDRLGRLEQLSIKAGLEALRSAPILDEQGRLLAWELHCRKP